MVRAEVSIPDKKRFRPDEVAALAGLSKRTIYRMVGRGELPGERPPGQKSVRIPRQAVLELLRRR